MLSPDWVYGPSGSVTLNHTGGISIENRSAEQEFLKNKRKRQSCSLRKPHKTGHVKRWKDKDQMLLKEADFDMRRIKYAASYTNGS
jgi:hypothetical protein